MMNDSSPWLQVNVTFPDWDHAEHTAASRLAPALDAGSTAGCWWFIRKHPCWRIRYRPGPGNEAIAGRRLDALASEGQITGWTAVMYEPETRAFGGPEAMAEAHRLFSADSHGVLAYLRGEPNGTHRREVTLMLCSIMMRAAGQDWYEQGDIWARVAGHRTLSPGPRPPGPSPAAVHSFLTARAKDQVRDGAPLSRFGQWASAYAGTGRALASLAAEGLLRRGLRDILAHHVIFAWNRLGLSYAAQSALAGTANTVVFGPDPRRAAAG